MVMTVLSLELASTDFDEFNKSRIIKNSQLEAEVFDIIVLGASPMDLYRVCTFLLMYPLIHLGASSSLIYAGKQS